MDKRSRKIRQEDKVGVFFKNEDKNGRAWYCAKVVEIGKQGGRRENEVKLSFKESKDDNGWYPMNEEMRLCEDIKGHQCSKLPVRRVETMQIEEQNLSLGNWYRVKGKTTRVRMLRMEENLVIGVNEKEEMGWYMRSELEEI